jgi:arsenate reductase-like glutaredoxin family protein
MNLNQEFHEHLQAGRLTEAISLVIGQLVELKITTKANSGRLHTTVDLLNGQITNTVDPAFFSDKSSQKLLEFHTNQITATSQVVREQLRSLQDLLQALTPPEVPRENIRLIALTEAITTGESDSVLSLAKQESEPVNSLAAAAPAIISAQISETLPVNLTETVPAIQTPSIVEQSDEILAPEQPISKMELQVAKAPENPSISQPEPLVARTPENLPISQEPQVAKIVEHPAAISQPPVTKAPEQLQISKPEEDDDITAADLETLSAKTAKDPVSVSEASWYENRSERVKLPETLPIPKPESRAGIASGLAAALAQTSALDPAEAAAIPNKFDQALRSAGVRSTTEEDPHPFVANKSVVAPIVNQPAIEQPTELIPRKELIDLLRESEDDWDEWLLEEDNILSELSDVTKDKVPDLESHWLSAATSGSISVKSSPSDWEEFMPEYPEVNTVASKNQANVERFRQNLVNDPQLMSELLAELDDLEEMEESKPKL